MRISTPQVYQQNLNAILEQQQALAKTQQQISTGKKLANPSDDPVVAVQVLNFERQANVLEQYIANGNTIIDKLKIEESIIASATNTLQRVRELGVQGLNGTYSTSDRADIAQEIRELNEQLLSLANSQAANGDYIFSGFSTDIKPYQSIGAGYAGDQGQRNIEVGPDVLIASNDPGSQIFESTFTQTVVSDKKSGGSSSNLVITDINTGNVINDTVTVTYATGPDRLVINVGSSNETINDYSPGQVIKLSDLNAAFPELSVKLEGTLTAGDSFTIANQISQNKTVFSTINSFANALEANRVGLNDSPNNGDFLTNISNVLDGVVDTRAKIGARINVIEQQKQVSNDLELSTKEILSGLQDLDYAEAVSKLSLQSTSLQAAQQTFARVQGLALFNYL